MKKALAVTLILAIVLTLSLAFTATAAEGDGFIVYRNKNAGDDFTGANIAPNGGWVDGTAYKLTFTITFGSSVGADNGIRVRWTGGDGYPDNVDSAIVNNYETTGTAGSNIPAYFLDASLQTAGNVVNYTVDFTYGAESEIDYSLVDSAAIVGRWTDDFKISNVKLLDASGADITPAVKVPGFIETHSKDAGNEFTGAIIVPDNGWVAGAYKLSFTVAFGDSVGEGHGIRVRWTGGYGYPDNVDSEVVNKYETTGTAGSNVPAYFLDPALVTPGNTVNYTVDFTYGAEPEIDYSLVDSAVIVGRWTDDFKISNIKLLDANGKDITPVVREAPVPEPEIPPPPDPPSDAPPVATSEPLFSWADEIKALAGKGFDGETTWLKNSGDASTKSLSGNTLRISESSRDNYGSNYCVIDVKLDNPSLVAGQVYTLVVSFSSSDARDFVIAPVVSPWTEAPVAGPVNATAARLTYKFTAPAANVRLQHKANGEFQINSVALYEGDPPETDASSLVFYAIGALALTGGGATFATIKLRKGKREE